MQIYDVPLVLKIFILGSVVFVFVALFGFVWYSNRKAKRKGAPTPKVNGRKHKRKRRANAY